MDNTEGGIEYTVQYGDWRGTRLMVGRIPRHLIDALENRYPRPIPPMVKASSIGVEVWGDEDELVPHEKDRAYLADLYQWNVDIGREQIALIAQAVTIPEDTFAKAMVELEEMRSLSIVDDESVASALRYILLPSDEDTNAVVELVMYQSTVTLRGMAEAAERFGVTHRNRPVTLFGSGKTGDTFANQEFNDRIAAQWAHCDWRDFCELPGPEQSAIAALYRIKSRIERMAMRSR